MNALPGPARRFGRYLTRPDVRQDRLRLLVRRVRYEAERRWRPGRLGRERLIPFDGDLRIWVRPRDVVDRAVYLYGVHENVSACAFSALARPGAVVLDVGAHIGQFTLLAAKRVRPSGRVLSFEPNPPVRDRLERNVAVNGFANVAVRPEALSARPGPARIHLPDDESRSGDASLAPGRASARSVSVECARLDDVLEEEGVDRVDLVKLDAEGLEHEVLEGGRGAVTGGLPAVLFEVNDLRETPSGFSAPAMEMLSGLGYRLYGMSAGARQEVRLHELAPGADPRPFREPWTALNLLALHPDSSSYRFWDHRWRQEAHPEGPERALTPA